VIWDDCRSLKAISLILIASAVAVVFIMVSAEMIIQLWQHARARYKDDFLILCTYINE
jgi:hypothetical protein